MSISHFPHQVAFLKLALEAIPTHLNAVDRLGELLDVGSDSVYRRVRGETALSFEEALKISKTFGISLDVAGMDSLHRVDFDAGSPIETAEDYAQYSQRVVERMLRIENSSGDLHMFYLSQDFPLFYIYLFPNLTRMKSYYWGRSILALPEFRELPYAQFVIPEHRQKIGLEVVRSYSHIATSEVWTNSCFLGTLKQLQYCWDTGMIHEIEDALAILDEMEQLLEVMIVQSDAGKKLNPLTGKPTGAEFKWYITDLSVGNNAVYMEKSSISHTFLSFNTFNFIETTNAAFNRQTDRWLRQLLRKSTLVSPTAIGVRDAYINKLKKQVDSIRQVILRQEDTLL